MRDPIYVIKGAGIAGQVLRRELAAHGFKAVLEDRATFPRDKVCGGILQQDSWNYLCDAFDLKETPVEVRKIAYYWGKEKISEFDAPVPMVYVPRFVLDAKLLESLVVHPGGEKLEGQRIEVDATGSYEANGEWIGFAGSTSYKTDALEMCYAPGMYCGINPTGQSYSHIAILAQRKNYKNMETLLSDVELHWGTPILGTLKGTPPIHYGYSGKAMAVGDAMMTTHPFLGLGMKHAILSSKLFARMASEGKLKDYQREHRKAFRRMQWASRITDWFYCRGKKAWIMPILKNKKVFEMLYGGIHAAGRLDPRLRGDDRKY